MDTKQPSPSQVTSHPTYNGPLHPTALTCTALRGFLLFGIGLVISGTRKNANQFSGITTDPANLLQKLVRAPGIQPNRFSSWPP